MTGVSSIDASSTAVAGEHTMIVVRDAQASAQARRHGYEPILVDTTPSADDIGRAGNVVVDRDHFAELDLEAVGHHDVGIWITGDGDPWMPALSAWQRTAKRAIDITVAATVLLVTAPLLILVALAIRLDTKGPIFYSQQRLGLNGRWFEMHKFRTMSVDNDAAQHIDYFAQLARGEAASNDGLFKIVDDPRITRVGKLLRRFSIDELPQFFDVARGAMSVVGPRPMLPRELKTLDGVSWKRQRVKPGITGLWQVSGRATTTFDTMIDLDIEYAEHWSLKRELSILFGTPAAILREETA